MVLKRLKSIFGSVPKVVEMPFDEPVRPDQPLYVFGDIHGCIDQLKVKISLAEDRDHAPDAKFVFIGDFVDRGPDSASTLKLLFERSQKNKERNIFILGNHERMMLEFVDDPAGKGRRWLQFGGLDTLLSFGIRGNREKVDLEDLVDVSLDLERAIGVPILEWLRDLPTHWMSGNVHCTHAALNPHAPIDDQENSVKLWGHPDFFKVVRSDGQWVVHGHTIVTDPSCHSGRIATDTGAYKTGRLTVAEILPNGTVEFI